MNIDKLSNGDIEEIRHLYWFTSEYVKDIAKKFNISINNVWKCAGTLEIECEMCENTINTTKRFCRLEPFIRNCQKCESILFLDELNSDLDKVKETIVELKDLINSDEESPSITSYLHRFHSSLKLIDIQTLKDNPNSIYYRNYKLSQIY